LLIGSVALFAILAPFVGMVTAAVIFVFLSGLVLRDAGRDQRFLVKLAVVSILAPTGCWFVFGQLLRVPLL